MKSPTYLGVFLGACAAACISLIVSIDIALDNPHDRLLFLVTSVMSWSFVLVPAGSIFGALLGRLAGKLRSRRLLVLEGAGLAAIFIAAVAIMETFVLIGVVTNPREMHAGDIPQATLIAVSVVWEMLPAVLPPVALGIYLLERWTRPSRAPES